MQMTQADIGLIGLAVMGQNLVLNMDDHGYTVAVYNRTYSIVQDFLSGPGKETQVIGTSSLNEFLGKLKRPRKIMLMVKAGEVVDNIIDQLLPSLEQGDVVIDGGNSNYQDSNRRYSRLKERGIFFIGAGVSGGEEGARHGPSIMPGGNSQAWPLVKSIFQDISAKVDSEPCCDWLGEAGSGHFVKMVHNGIEYGDMQLISEAYHILEQGLGIEATELADIFTNWDKGELNSYLIEISGKIFSFKDKNGSYLVNKILDVAGQKGTGKWTSINALDFGIPLTLISEAVFARFLSSMKDEREQASKYLGENKGKFQGDKQGFIESVKQALFASKIISYAQGFMLLRQASTDFSWDLNYGAIALIWRGGCIIRSGFLREIKKAFDQDSNLSNLLLDDFFKEVIQKADAGWRQVVMTAFELQIPAPCMASSLAFYDGYRSARLPHNLLQAQRDFFGAHTYERVDKPRGEFFHTNWTGEGGDVSSTQYNA